MKLFDGTDTLDMERKEEGFWVSLLSTQFRKEALEDIKSQVEVREEGEDQISLLYPLPKSARSLAQVIEQTKTRVERLKLAEKLQSLQDLKDKYKVPFLHPENIYLDENRLFVVHFGLVKTLVPMTFDELQFVKSYKALMLQIFNPKTPFEQIIDGFSAFTDKWSQTLIQSETIQEISDLIGTALVREIAKENQEKTYVSKKRYLLLRVLSMGALVLALVLAVFTMSYHGKNKIQKAIITAQTDFLTADYGQTQTDLKAYGPGQLPKSARYILAVSSVNLSDLSKDQKDKILGMLSTKTDDNTLNYWLYSGRGDFDQALNLAQNLGDDQLTLLAYTNLYQTTKLNSSMPGEKKQKLLETYSKKIEDLSKSLGR